MADAEQLTFDQALIRYLDLSQDGRLIVDSDRGGNQEVWLVTGRDGMRQLTTDRGSDQLPRW
jgi:hypothetical protein